jgi:2-polyprenyl-6-methoxyphenol hydroxylase-like FAD-dependent oxidoreductase
MAERLHADVVVVGAGPAGLTLAVDLAWRGVDVIVLESTLSNKSAWSLFSILPSCS